MYLEFKHNDIPKSKVQQIENTGDDGGAGSKCRRGKYELKPSTKARLVLQLAEHSEWEEDE
jgi:hypothetical protein